MAVTAQGTGTQTTVIGTPNTLLDVAVAGVFSLHLDLINLADGDVLEIRIYQIVLTGGTRRVVFKSTRVDAQNTDDMILISGPIANELTDSGSLRFEIKQTSGSVRTIDWKVLKY